MKVSVIQSPPNLMISKLAKDQKLNCSIHRDANKSLTTLLIEKPPNSTIEIVNNTAAAAHITVVKNLF